LFELAQTDWPETAH